MTLLEAELLALRDIKTGGTFEGEKPRVFEVFQVRRNPGLLEDFVALKWSHFVGILRCWARGQIRSASTRPLALATRRMAGSGGKLVSSAHGLDSAS